MARPQVAGGRRRGGAWVAAVIAGVALAIAAGCDRGVAREQTTAAGPTAPPPPPPPVRYGRDVRPLLADRCFRCHGPDAGKRQAHLRLDDPASATARGEDCTPIVPGDAAASEVWRRVTSEDPEVRMPPPESGRPPLDAREQALVRRWIEQGAQYEPHWSFVPPQKVEPPAVAATGWPRNEIDRFVLARLEREGIAPSPEADRATLLRRLFQDLTGLPPTPEELDRFLGDAAPDAYEQQVRVLLEQEPYRSRHAEHLATPWLDAARYADTCGLHTDAGRSIWPWRDWVLAAFRDNLPFDRFLTEQLAGDLLPDATEAQQVATGFLRNHVTTDEGGAIAEEYLVEYAVDRVATTGSVFLGLTLGCARCHDHKFDPITQQDFYGLFAFFNSNDEPGLYSQLPDAKRAHEPFLAVPAPAQRAELHGLRAELAATREAMGRSDPGEDSERREYQDTLHRRLGLRWAGARVTGATSRGGATLSVEPDGSVLATGKLPASDVHVLTLATDATDLRLVRIDALTHASRKNRLGRTANGNAVLTGVTAVAVAATDPSRTQPLRFTWAVADHEQQNGDHAAVNVLDSGPRGWAVDGHRRPGSRVLLLLADEPFGFAGGTRLELTLRYESEYPEHAFARVRVDVGQLADSALAVLPAAVSGWYSVGPFPDPGEGPFAHAFGPERETALVLTKNFGAGNLYWRHQQEARDGRVHKLAEGVNATYLGRRVFAPTARKLELSLGSDDGIRVFVNGTEQFAREAQRTAAPDQDRATIDLQAGQNLVVLKIANTGGSGGWYHRALPREGELAGDLVLGLLPDELRNGEYAARVADAWRRAFSPDFARRSAVAAALEERIARLEAAIPKTMVMRELEKPRPAFVLNRGEYDQPDRARPAPRAIPAAFGALPDDAPRDRRALARWLTSPDQPLVARVAVNRQWELLFGTGLVRTSEDFGLQGEWPSHPELLDWLAVDLREHGWDRRRLLVQIVTSSTYRQSSRARPELATLDPDNRLLAAFPRRRLGAEQLRDQALWVAGLLVERLGGPSVQTYQPPGLWEEVSMTQSNTRKHQPGQGEDLWRRSLYTYWKRACPPPALMALDAPTREFCQVRRLTTNTPLQSLALWNDPQLVEAARVLAQRTLGETDGDEPRLARMFRRCTGRAPEADERATLARALAGFRTRYRAEPDAAARLLAVGTAPRTASAGADDAELAAWTLVANTILNLDATITRS